MDKEIDKKLNEFTGKLLKDFSRESPSFDFTTQVMSQVEVLSKSHATQYKPLITKKIWLVLGVFFVGIFSYLIFGNAQIENSLIPPLRFDALPKLDSIVLLDYSISDAFLYGIIGTTFFIGIQVFILKNRFEKRLA